MGAAAHQLPLPIDFAVAAYPLCNCPPRAASQVLAAAICIETIHKEMDITLGNVLDPQVSKGKSRRGSRRTSAAYSPATGRRLSAVIPSPGGRRRSSSSSTRRGSLSPGTPGTPDSRGSLSGRRGFEVMNLRQV